MGESKKELRGEIESLNAKLAHLLAEGRGRESIIDRFQREETDRIRRANLAYEAEQREKAAAARRETLENATRGLVSIAGAESIEIEYNEVRQAAVLTARIILEDDEHAKRIEAFARQSRLATGGPVSRRAEKVTLTPFYCSTGEERLSYILRGQS